MSNEISVNGECHCGNISISAIVDKNKVRVCHCTDCQNERSSLRAIAEAQPIQSQSMVAQRSI